MYISIFSFSIINRQTIQKQENKAILAWLSIVVEFQTANLVAKLVIFVVVEVALLSCGNTFLGTARSGYLARLTVSWTASSTLRHVGEGGERC